MNVAAVFEDAQRRLARAGVDHSRLEARVLVGSVLGIDSSAVLGRPDAGLSDAQKQRLETLVARRARREPLALILESREFWSLDFQVSEDTLIPRADSETIVEAALAWARGGEDVATILDLGTGSGCLLLALLHELPAARGVGVDISGGAVRVARNNARSLGLDGRARFLQGDWGMGIEAAFPMIVVNPPYIPQGDIHTLAPEVCLFEPSLALSGGADGLDCYRVLAPQLARLLAPSGRVFMEVGQGQASPVIGILRQHGLRPDGVINDLAGIGRCIVIKK